MRKIKILLLLFISILCCLSCFRKISKRSTPEQVEKIKECVRSWEYKVIDETHLKVIAFKSAYQISLFYYPNFVICTTETGDTIGIADYFLITDPKEKKMYGNSKFIRKNDIIKVRPVEVTLAMEHNPPAYTLTSDARENDLYCSVKTVYYAEIMAINGKPINRKNKSSRAPEE